MALSLVKVGILVGAGILGSCLAKEGRVSDMVSGALKVQDDKSKTPSVKKPSNDALMAQALIFWRMAYWLDNSNCTDEQNTAGAVVICIKWTNYHCNRESNSAGASRYGIIVVVVVAGYGYFWWKGWKLRDMLFATRRSLADAGKSFPKQIDSVFSSISVTKRQLSSNLDGVDRNLAESLETLVRTQQEVIELQGKTDSISTDFRKVQHAVLTLETKINRIEGKQDSTNDGVWRLCDYAKRLENSRTTEQIQPCVELLLLHCPARRSLELPPASPSSLVTPPKSSRPALELPSASPSRTGSLPHDLESEPCRLGSIGIQENNCISEVFEPSALESTSNGASSSGRFGFKYPTSNTSTILRTRSATIGMLQQNRSASKQF